MVGRVVGLLFVANLQCALDPSLIVRASCIVSSASKSTANVVESSQYGGQNGVPSS